MRFSSKALGLSAFSWSLLSVLAGLCFGGELIAPTRTLEEPGQRWGRLAVFSEPPELKVLLNGENVGRTPLWLDKLEAGFYVLKVAGAETEIIVTEAKPTKIGLFKGSFVAFPEAEKEATHLSSEAPGPHQTPQLEMTQEKQRKKDLTMWEVLIGGSSVRLWEQKK
jgi:hypothetical protein